MEIQINLVLRKAAAGSRVGDNLVEADRVRVVRADRAGGLSVRVVSVRVVGAEVVGCGRPRPQQLTPDRTALAFFDQRGL